MWKDSVCQLGKWIAAWLLRCWDAEAHRQELEGKEAQKLRYLARDRGIDKEIGREATMQNLRRWLLSSIKARFLLREDLVDFLREVDHC